MRALGAWNANVRVAAVETLERIGDPRGVEPLIKTMGSEFKPVREAAAWALFRIGDRRVIDPMIKALRDGYEPVRVAAAYTLGRFAEPQVVDPLAGPWGTGSTASGRRRRIPSGRPGTRARRRAADPRASGQAREGPRGRGVSLAKFRDPRALDPLAGTLGDGIPEVRVAAIWSLGELGDRRAVDAILPVLGDDNTVVRKAAAQVLERLGEPLGRLILAALKGFREAREELAGKKDPRCVEPLVRALRNPEKEVRRAAASALGAVGDPRAVDGLVFMAGGWNLADRVAALWALLRIDQPVIPDLAVSLFRVAARPASIVYFLLVAFAAILAGIVYRRRRAGAGCGPE